LTVSRAAEIVLDPSYVYFDYVLEDI